MARHLNIRVALVAVTAALGPLAFAPGAQADSLLSTTVAADDARDRDCTSGPLGGAGVDSESVTAPALGAVQARLDGGSGDWDLAVLDAETGRTVAGSAYSGSTELAEGYVSGGQDLVVQACRLSGDATSAELAVDLFRIDADGAEPASLVNVHTSNRTEVAELQELGLDLTEHAGDGFVQVVTYGEDDLETLREAGFSYSVQVEDLARQSARHRAAEERRADSSRELPSGRTAYRRLFNYSEELKQLAAQNADLVKHFTLPNTTYEGRPVEGIEITTNPNARDGKPVFVQLGLHHAREWPSGEHAMEWAYELINGFRSGDPRVVNLVQSTRTIVVPVVNPDGFNASREAGELQGAGGGSGGDDLVNIATSPNEYRRKNCRFPPPAENQGGNCAEVSAGLIEPGVDPNRNYGGFWGGPGASTDFSAQDYRGPGPFSEPETKNIQHLVSTHQVTTLITNHTYSALVLRPPGLASEPNPVDDGIYTELGNAMAGQNGYVSQRGYELYDTSGTTEDWSYNATGGLGFTFEIGCNGEPPDNCIGNFHPPFQQMVAEYDGTSPLAQAVGGGGNRGAYFLAQENTADPSKHSVIEGDAPGLATLRLHKAFLTPTSPVLDENGEEGEKQFVNDTLNTLLDVPDSGQYEWHINPSTRPLVAQDKGRPATGPPSPGQTFSGAPGPIPDPTGAVACADFETNDPSCWNDHAFTVPAGGGVDNAGATVRIEWPSPVSDWDMKVFVDSNGDGSSVGETQSVGQSAQGGTESESTTFVEPILQPGQQYVVRVINFAAAEPYEGTINFEGPREFEPAQTEQWTFTCEFPEGNVLSSQQVLINRGERKTLNLDEDCKIGLAAAKLACKTAPTIKGNAKRNKLKGTPGSDVITARGGKDKVSSGKGDDVICLGRGRDKGKGGSGDDIVLGNGGADNVKGGSGDDQLFGNRSRDRLRGGSGKDRCKGGPGKDSERSC